MKKNSIILLPFFFSAFLLPQEQFTEQISISLTGVGSSSVAWGDYDNDGDLDILLTGYTEYPAGQRSKIYLNNGNNAFSEQTEISLTGVYESSVAWGDYDNDGDLDILLTGAIDTYTGLSVSKIYRNDGDNTFTEQTSISLAAVYYSSVAWGDYDNDGDLDILLTGWAGTLVSKIYEDLEQRGGSRFGARALSAGSIRGWPSAQGPRFCLRGLAPAAGIDSLAPPTGELMDYSIPTGAITQCQKSLKKRSL